MEALALSPTCPSHPNKPWRRDTTSHFTKEVTQTALHTASPVHTLSTHRFTQEGQSPRPSKEAPFSDSASTGQRTHKMSDRKRLLESKEEAGQRSCWIRADAEQQQQDTQEQGQREAQPSPRGPQTSNPKWVRQKNQGRETRSSFLLC